MNKTSCCRVCLAENVKMQTLINSPLQELYENLTSTKVHPHKGKPTALCYLCYALLQQCYKLQQTARRSEAILSQLYLDGVTITDSKLSLFPHPILHRYITTTVEHINIYNERDRYTCNAKQERDRDSFDNGGIKEENGQDDHDITNTQTLDPYECKQHNTSVEVSFEPRAYETNQQNNLYLEIDGLKQCLTQDFSFKVNSKERDVQELTSDSEPISSARCFEEYPSVNSKTCNRDFDSLKNDTIKNSKSYSKTFGLKYYYDDGSKNSSQNLDSVNDTKICNQNIKYIHYSQNLKLDDNSIYDDAKYLAKNVNSQLPKMVEPSNIRKSNLTSNVTENLNLTSNVSQNQNLTFKVSNIDNDECRLTDTQASPYESDSEDDLPLKMLRKRTLKKKMSKEKEISKREYRKASNIGVSVMLVSRTDQLAALAARASSHNYLHSTYKCQYCYRGFLTEEVYRKHMEKHDVGRGGYVCPVCRLRYRTPRLLAAHGRAAHQRRYICTLCNHTSTTKNQAIDHQRIHNGDLFECKMCNKSFHARTSYISHMRGSHPTSGGSSVCNTCGDRFVSAQGLAMHRAKVHAHNVGDEFSLARERGFVCISCGERFDNQLELDEHRNDKHRDVLAEDNARAITKYCSSCDIHFASRRAYTRHVLNTPAHLQLAAHTKECPICFTSIQDTVRSHMRVHDRETKPRTTKPTNEAKLLQCDKCSQSFANKSRLNAHVRRVHLGLKYNKNLVCELCGKNCTSAARLRYHQRTHTGERPYPCLVSGCGARFPDSNQLRIHTRTHTGEKPYTCDTCGASFAQRPALNRHSRVHTGLKPHSCDICNKSFTQSNSLNTHIKSVHLKMPRKLYSKSTYVRKSSQNPVETKKNNNLAVNVSGQLTSSVAIEGSEISDVTLVDSQVQSKINLRHP